MTNIFLRLNNSLLKRKRSIKLFFFQKQYCYKNNFSKNKRIEKPYDIGRPHSMIRYCTLRIITTSSAYPWSWLISSTGLQSFAFRINPKRIILLKRTHSLRIPHQLTSKVMWDIRNNFDYVIIFLNKMTKQILLT